MHIFLLIEKNLFLVFQLTFFDEVLIKNPGYHVLPPSYRIFNIKHSLLKI